MSRYKKPTGKHKGNNRTEQPVTQRARGQALMQSFSQSPAKFTPLTDNVMNSMYQQMAPQKDGTPFYAPGAPLRPIPGITPQQGPRQYEYPQSYNISQLPRSTEDYSFDELRSLSKLYDGIQLCEQVWFDYISKLELVIEPREDLMQEDQDESKYASEIQLYKDFFAFPDKDHDLKSWLRMAVRDQLELDALSIYIRRNKAGGVYSLDIIDGSTMKPLIDDRGRKPAPPYPAFEQYVYGVPAALLTSDDLIYVKETERSESVYGRPRVERIILKVNQALRKQNKDLLRFTDGTVPSGVVETPIDNTWTQDQIEGYQMQFDGLLAGNDQQRSRVHFLPKGFTYKSTDDTNTMQHLTEFDTFLLNATAACFGLTMAELGFTENVNKSSGDSQENVVYRRAMQPLMSRYAELFTHILRKYFNENRFVVKWKGFEEVEDFQAMASAYSTLVTNGIQSPTQAALAMHLPVYNDIDIPPYTLTKTGPVFLEDLADPKMRQAQQQAQMAGLQMTIANPGQKPGDDQQPGDGGDDDQEDGPNKKPSESKPDANDDKSDRSANIEYRRWRDAAINDLKAKRPVRIFQSALIPTSTLAMGHAALLRCSSASDVKQIFESMRSIQYA